MDLAIFITGFMGSGKTFWGKIWARENQLHFFDLDEEIEKIEGVSIANIFEEKGEDYFRERERDALRTFDGKKNYIVASGGGTPCFFNNMQWMNEQGLTVYLKASAGQIIQNIKNETMQRPLLNKLDPAELQAFITKRLQERETFYNQAKHIIAVDGLRRDTLAGILMDINHRAKL